MLPDYVELHALSNFTFLRGASHPEELVTQAQALGYGGLAVTDECSLAGIVRAHVAAHSAGLKLIVGSEFRLQDGLRLILLVTDRDAYGDLAELISVGRRQAEKGSYQLGRADVARYAQRLLALWLPNLEQADDELGWLRQTFAGRCWMAVELFQEADDLEQLALLSELGQRHDIPLLASGDVHMHRYGRRLLQNILTAIRLNTVVSECGEALHQNGERHLRSRMQLARIYPPQLLAETLQVAARCRFSLDELRYEYPSEVVPADLTPAQFLRQLTEAGLRRRYVGGVPAEVRVLVDKELALIAELRYEHYFLTVYDIVAWARDQGILCQGRGSAANSAVCYALGITEVDPGRMSMLFERFISKERAEPPDIDVDFEHERREEVIQYIYRRYGRERAALTATVITYHTRGAVRDIGRVLGFSSAQLEALSKSLGWWDRPDELPTRLREVGLDPQSHSVQLLHTLVQTLRGFPRHLSQHPGGFVISNGPLHRLVPIENASMAERTVIQWDKNDLDAMGLLKIDILALGMLSAIRRALQLVAGRQGQRFELADIPAEDPAVYAMIGRADTVGVFQIESRAQMSMLPRLQPNCFYDLVIEIAIIRPGPIQGGMVHPYLRRRLGLEAVDYPSEQVRGVLERTLGIPLFQEQVMQLAIVAAGFSPGEADHLRRSMAAWRRTGKLAHFRTRLLEGMQQRGYSAEFAERLFKQIEGFSEYGFPESHAASFALLAYASAWLKCHQPAAFLCALLNSYPMGFYTPSQLIQDSARHGLEIRAIDVQHSQWECTLEATAAPQPAVRLGLCLVNGLNQQAARQLVARRPATGFADLDDLRRRSRPSSATLQVLAQAGALAELCGHRRQAWWQVAGLELTQDLLDHATRDEPPAALSAPSIGEDVVADYAGMGLSLRAHPLALLRPRLAQQRMVSAADISHMNNQQLARAAGLVVGRQRPGTANGVTFVTLEDETGNINVIVWPDLGERQRRELLAARLLVVYGVVQREGRVVHLIAKRLVDRSGLLGDLNATVTSRDFR